MLKGAHSGDACKLSARLLVCVANAFPELSVTHSRVETRGGDHLLLIVNDAIAFRFPRSGMHDLRLEIAVLRIMQRLTSLQTPIYNHLDPAGRFAGYRFIDGVELTPLRFAALSGIAINQILGEAAQFLRDLHAIPPAAVAWADEWPNAWTTAQFADRALDERVSLIVRHVPHLAWPLDRFYRLYRDHRAPRQTIIHGDLVPEHILLDQDAERLTGIIDFSDVALGDPAQDLLGFWSYGEDVASRLVALYASGEPDPGLLVRSRNHFIRYRIDQLYETIGQEDSTISACKAAEVQALLSWIDFG